MTKGLELLEKIETVEARVARRSWSVLMLNGEEIVVMAMSELGARIVAESAVGSFHRAVAAMEVQV